MYVDAPGFFYFAGNTGKRGGAGCAYALAVTAKAAGCARSVLHRTDERRERGGLVRSRVAAPDSALEGLKCSSIGLRNGEYGGRNISPTPAAFSRRIMSSSRWWWVLQLSIITTSP